MTHFTTLVLMDDGSTLEGMLAPYNEGIECEPRVEMPRAEFVEYARKFYRNTPEIFTLSDDDFIEAMRGDYTLDADGNNLTTYNPKSKWDWWTIGGCWPDMLRLTREAYTKIDSINIVLSASGVNPLYCNSAKLKYLDFSPDPQKYENSKRYWELAVEDAEPSSEEEKEIKGWAMHAADYYAERFGTKESFAEFESKFQTWAVVTPDGAWHDIDNMEGWTSSDGNPEQVNQWVEKYKERFLDSADPECTAVLVDCHI